MTDAIVTTQLTKYYGRRRVVHDLNLRIPTGTVYGLLGRNGSGKTTTIKMLLGMVEPDFGQAALLGEPVHELSNATRRRIAYLAEGHPLYQWMTVGELVRFTSSFYRSWNQPVVRQILEHFELPLRAKMRRLSNGQRAQVSLALAVATEPDLLILDDPTLGLDTVVRRDLLESLIQLIQRQGRTILFSSHILGDVERVADRIGILDDGVLRVDCPTDHFKRAVRRVVLRFPNQPPSLAGCDGVLAVQQSGTTLDLVIAGFNDRHQSLFESLAPLSCDVIEMNLEDAFIAYTRGARPTLPTFVEDNRHVPSAAH